MHNAGDGAMSLTAIGYLQPPPCPHFPIRSTLCVPLLSIPSLISSFLSFSWRTSTHIIYYASLFWHMELLVSCPMCIHSEINILSDFDCLAFVIFAFFLIFFFCQKGCFLKHFGCEQGPKFFFSCMRPFKIFSLLFGTWNSFSIIKVNIPALTSFNFPCLLNLTRETQFGHKTFWLFAGHQFS